MENKYTNCFLANKEIHKFYTIKKSHRFLELANTKKLLGKYSNTKLLITTKKLVYDGIIFKYIKTNLISRFECS